MCVFLLPRCWSLALLRPLGMSLNYCGWTVYKVVYVRVCVFVHMKLRERECTEACIGVGPAERQGPNCISSVAHPQACAHTEHIHFCISLPYHKGIKGTFKERLRDWPGACRVPLLASGGPGQIKAA